MTLLAFNIALDRFVDEEVPEKVLLLTRAIAAQLLRGVVLKSPVDTGRFRSAWFVTVDSTTAEQPPIESYAERKARHVDPIPPADEVIDAGLAMIDAAKPFQVITLQNNVDYAVDLENGGSRRQAPQGVLAITVAEVEASLA